MTAPLRMGRISYLNVLPIYHPLEAGIIPHDYELVAGPPALLNEMMGRENYRSLPAPALNTPAARNGITWSMIFPSVPTVR